LSIWLLLVAVAVEKVTVAQAAQVDTVIPLLEKHLVKTLAQRIVHQ
jgi:hypothetical protein